MFVVLSLSFLPPPLFAHHKCIIFFFSVHFPLSLIVIVTWIAGKTQFKHWKCLFRDIYFSHRNGSWIMPLLMILMHKPDLGREYRSWPFSDYKWTSSLICDNLHDYPVNSVIVLFFFIGCVARCSLCFFFFSLFSSFHLPFFQWLLALCALCTRFVPPLSIRTIDRPTSQSRISYSKTNITKK